MKSLKTVWTDHCKTPEDKLKFEKTVRNSARVLLKLKEILEKEMDGLNKVQTQDFANPNWAYNQAFELGQRFKLQKLIELIDFME